MSLHGPDASSEGFQVTGTGHAAVAQALLDWLENGPHQTPLGAVGHRVVHGGRKHSQAQRVDNALLGGLDALILTAGIGEKATAVRRAIGAELGWLGIEIDETANAHHARRLDTGRGPLVCVLTADEAAEIHRSVTECLVTVDD